MFQRCLITIGVVCMPCAIRGLPACAQGIAPFSVHHGDAVPRDVRELYERGLQYLINSQSKEGDWKEGQTGPGITGMALMTFLASGEDPNFGKYSKQVKSSVKSIVGAQNESTGYIGNSMYHHGFAMLGLAEAYGAVDDRRFWGGNEKKSIGITLELAVRCALTSQKKNSLGAWRYSPDAQDADTSVSGAILVGLLAARNAGIEVPDKNIDKAISYYKNMTSQQGHVGYSGGFGGGFDESIARISIASLVYALARRRDLKQYQATTNYLTNHLESSTNHYEEYGLYYQSQALFHGDMDAWKKWNKMLVIKLKNRQAEDGSFRGSFGKPTATAMSLLALALNYRFLPIYER